MPELACQDVHMLSLNGNMCTIVHMLTERDTIVHMLSQLLFHLFPLRARSRSNPG